MTKNNNFKLDLLKEVRLGQGWSVGRMADMLGISNNAYYKKENGTTNITVDEFSIIAHTLRIPNSQYHKFFSAKPTLDGCREIDLQSFTIGEYCNMYNYSYEDIANILNITEDIVRAWDNEGIIYGGFGDGDDLIFNLLYQHATRIT